MSLTLSGDSPKISADSTGVLTSGTAVTASGTSVDFTDIPSWVKRITVMFSGVSTNSTSPLQIQIGDSGGIENTSYNSFSSAMAAGVASASATSGFVLTVSTTYTLAAGLSSGNATLTKLNENTWCFSGIFTNTTYNYSASGSKTLSDVLDRVRITTVNGTDTFDAGSINILYE